MKSLVNKIRERMDTLLRPAAYLHLPGFPAIVMLLFVFLAGCEKDIEQRVVIPPATIPAFKATASNVVLTKATADDVVLKFSFEKPDYGVNAVPAFSLQFDTPSDTAGANGWAKAVEVKLAADSMSRSFTGSDLNSILVNQLKLPVGAQSTIVVRLKADIKQPTGEASAVPPVYSVLTMDVTTYESAVVYPALLVRGGNGWITPAVRTDGLVLTSANFNNKYEGYIYLPNADQYGGDAFKLESTATGKFYGWGSSATTIQEGASGNLWLEPAPNYMKVNVDVDALTINFTPVRFYISGDNNNWSTSVTPMTYDKATKKWTATVPMTAGNTFAFTANDAWQITYKVDGAGKLIFAGDPVWGGNNIVAPKTGDLKITLDLSQGDGNYTYSIE